MPWASMNASESRAHVSAPFLKVHRRTMGPWTQARATNTTTKGAPTCIMRQPSPGPRRPGCPRPCGDVDLEGVGRPDVEEGALAPKIRVVRQTSELGDHFNKFGLRIGWRDERTMVGMSRDLALQVCIGELKRSVDRGHALLDGLHRRGRY